MRRAGRIALNLLTVLSLLLCVGTVGLWVRSARLRDDVDIIMTDRWALRGYSSGRRLVASLDRLDEHLKGDGEWTPRSFQHFTDTMVTGENWPTPEPSLGGDTFAFWHFQLRTFGGIATTWTLGCRLGWVAVVAGLLPSGRFLALLVARRRRARAPGLCPRCRYDLTGNVSGTCPECGTATGKAVA